MFKKIGLAIAFSPTCKALLTEALRVQKLFGAQLLLVHVGMKTEGNTKYLHQLFHEVGIREQDIQVIWEEGKPARKILEVCRREKIDLIMAGALKRENLFNYYIGTVARKIMRRATCSVLILVNPSEVPAPFREIVIHAGETFLTKKVVDTGMGVARADHANQVHMVRELHLYGLAMSVSSENPEKESTSLRKKLVKEELKQLEKYVAEKDRKELKINFKILAGKSGFEVGRFAKRTGANLLVVGARPKKFPLFDKVFTHDLEYVFADLPCNLLVVKQK